MLLSIIVPCYNSEKYIKETLESIKNQEFQDWECIIVNDGSTDQSENIIKDFIKDDCRFKLISTENNGVGKARNIALQNAQGKYILPIDSDDLLVSDFTQKGIAFLEQYPNKSLFGGSVEYFGEDKEPSVFPCFWINYQFMLKQDTICVSAIYRKDRALEIGGYNETLEGHEDYEFWIRYLYHNDKIKIIRDVGFKYRQRKDSRHNSLNKEKLLDLKQQIRILNKEIYEEYGEKV